MPSRCTLCKPRACPGVQKHCEVGEGYEYKESINMRKVGRVLRTRSNLCCIGQGLPGSLPWGVILTYLNDFFVQEQRLSMELAYSVRHSDMP